MFNLSFNQSEMADLNIAETGFIVTFFLHNTEYLLLCYDSGLDLCKELSQDNSAGGGRRRELMRSRKTILWLLLSCF